MSLQGLLTGNPPPPTPADGGRSGVAKSETPQDKYEGRLNALERILPGLVQLMKDLGGAQVVRENSSRVLKLNTNTAPLTNAEGQKFDCVTMFGAEANSIAIWSVGGGTLEVNVNGQGWVPVQRGDVPVVNRRIHTFSVRVTTGATGTAILDVGAYVPGGR